MCRQCSRYHWFVRACNYICQKKTRVVRKYVTYPLATYITGHSLHIDSYLQNDQLENESINWDLRIVAYDTASEKVILILNASVAL